MNRSLAWMCAIILFAFIGLPARAHLSDHYLNDSASDRGVPNATALTLKRVVPAADTPLQLSPIFATGAVLQRGVALPVWGTGSTGASVTVTFNGITETTQVDADGNWRVDFLAMDAGGPYAMTVTSGVETIQLTDMYLGDVWLASGQSNMEWTVSQLPIASEVIAAANDPEIRQFKVSSSLTSEPKTTLPATSSWKEATPSTVGDFSAVGYFFAKHLRDHVDVPIGIINATYGGSRIETWMSEEMLGYDEEDVILADGAPYRQPTLAYNAMIHPLLPFPVKGFLWYQGESNNATLPDVTAYAAQFQTLIQGWRSSWGLGDLPFFWVQLPNFGGVPGPIPSQSHLWPLFRASQDSALVLPNTGQAITIDIGDPVNIHPPDKEPVGYRLSLIARKQVYGQDIVDSGPVPAGDVVHVNGRVSIPYDHVGSGLVADPDGVPGSFTLLGENGTYVRGEAAIEGDKVVVWHDDVPVPVLVRYAWENNPLNPNLYNGEGLPAAPFEAAVSPYVEPPVETATLALGDLNLGVAAHDPRTGTGYILYSEESVHTRFASAPPSAWAADHLIAVVFEDGAWLFDRNKSVLVPFTPRSSDRLLVEIDFGANTANHLAGVDAAVEGINAGYVSGDLLVTPEMWGGAPDIGEFWVSGTEVVINAAGLNRSPVLAAIEDQFNDVDEAVALGLSATDSDGDPISFSATGLPPGLGVSGSEITGTISAAGVFNVVVTASDGAGGSDTTTFSWTVDSGDPSTTIPLALGDLKLGIAAHDQRTGPGYIMYSEEPVHTRFADNPPSAWNADHLIAVVFDNGAWKIDRNKFALVPFTPLPSDHLLASVDFGTNEVVHLVGINTVVEGINAGMVSGDLVITPDMWDGAPNEGEFGVTGTTVEIPGTLAQSMAGGDNTHVLALAAREIPDGFDLNAIYPNPFNSTTTIEYHVPEESPVRIEIVNIAGQRVNVLIDNRTMPAGRWRSVWDGTADNGMAVAAGVYMVQMQANGYREIRKVVLIR
ncbi:MAG: sialate O-acetylesterase [Rhodothermales bacterium]